MTSKILQGFSLQGKKRFLESFFSRLKEKFCISAQTCKYPLFIHDNIWWIQKNMVLPIRSTYLEIRGYTSYDIKNANTYVQWICKLMLEAIKKTTIYIATPKSCVSQAKIFAGICTSQSKLIEWALLCWFTHLNLSCPAVSQICNFTDFPPTFTTLEPNSTPMVWLESCLTTQKIINVKVNVVPLCEMTQMMKNEVVGCRKLCINIINCSFLT